MPRFSITVLAAAVLICGLVLAGNAFAGYSAACYCASDTGSEAHKTKYLGRRDVHTHWVWAGIDRFKVPEHCHTDTGVEYDCDEDIKTYCCGKADQCPGRYMLLEFKPKEEVGLNIPTADSNGYQCP